MDFIQTVLVFVFTLGLLVTIHEWGHFIVARLCGVQVLRFCVGFGKVVYSKTGKNGTEFALAAIPLGGYVKMLDEREGEVATKDRHLAFNTKSVWQRIAIVAAGPAVNIVFAIFAYWFLFLNGTTSVLPVVGGFIPNSVSAASKMPTGVEIVAIDGTEVSSWQDVNLKLVSRIGDTGAVTFRVQELADTNRVRQSEYSISLQDWEVDLEKMSPVTALGLVPFRPVVVPIIARVTEGGRAGQAGMKVQDKVIRVDGKDVSTWNEFVAIVQVSPEELLTLEVERSGRVIAFDLVPAMKTLETGKNVGFIGAAVVPPQWPEEMLRTVNYGVIDSLFIATAKTWQMINLTLSSIKKMIEGIISVKNLSGPITIAKVASASASSGLESYIGFLAYLSISLGVLNLLPIPMLDGGHLFYYVIEVIKGKPVSEQFQNIGLRLGMAVLFSLMAVAIFNDFMRL